MITIIPSKDVIKRFNLESLCDPNIPQMLADAHGSLIWYVDLYALGSVKYNYIFMNRETRYSFIVTDIPSKDINDVMLKAVNVIGDILYQGGVPADVVPDFITHMSFCLDPEQDHAAAMKKLNVRYDTIFMDTEAPCTDIVEIENRLNTMPWDDLDGKSSHALLVACMNQLLKK